MKCLHAIGTLRTQAGGPAVALRQMAANLSQLGASCHIACDEAEEGDAGSGGAAPGVLVSTFQSRGPAELLRAPPQRLRDLVAQADIIHLHGIWEALVINAARAARGLGKPVVCTPHGMLSPWSMARHRFRKLPYYQLFTKPMLQGAAAIHFVTEMEADLAASRLPRGIPRFVVPIFPSAEFYGDPPSNDEALKYFPQVPGGGPWVLFLSRIHPGKGLPEVIAAFPNVLAESPSAQLVIAGSGTPTYEGAMRRLVARAGIAGSAHFLGLVRGQAKLALYRRAAILAVPSSHENFGMVFVESLACGTPVLVTPETGIGREILEAGAGFATQASGEAVSRDLPAALRDTERLRAAGEAGRKWVLEHLAPLSIAGKMVEMYQSVLDQSARPRQNDGH